MNNKKTNKNHTLNNNKCKTCRGWASLGDPNSKGITLIALIITIIVMLILVGVTVNVALNGGLFKTAQDAGKQTEIEADRETLQAGIIGALNTETLEISNAQELENNLPEGWTVDGTGLYTVTSPNGNKFTVLSNGEIYAEGEEPPIELPQGWTETNKPEGWSDKVTAITDGTNTIALPDGFEISKNEKEDSIAEGLVVKEGANEFVWIPVANAETYTEDSFGPLEAKDIDSKAPYDSQETLDYYYGKKEDGSSYYNYAEDFTYAQDKTNVEKSIQTYGGFYVGRYETTIDEKGKIGSMKNKPILTADKTIKEGINPNNNEPYHYRWWGLYKAQKDIYANSPSVGSLMISSKQWDEIIRETGYGDATRPTDTYTTKPDLPGSAYKTDSSKYDESKNIYDLAGNVEEWTMEPDGSKCRFTRGGYYDDSYFSTSHSNFSFPNGYSSYCR